MKRILALVLSVLMVVVFMASCGSTSSTNTPAATAPAASTATAPASTAPAGGDKPLIGISVQQAPTGWVAAVQYYAEKTAKELGLNYKLVAAADPNEQASQIDDLINMKPKIIILFPANDQVAVAAQKIKDAGITLMDFDRTINPTEPDYYLAGDNYGMGVAGANYIAEKLNKKGNVIIATVASWGDINNQRVQGFKDTIKNFPDIKVVGTYDSPNAAPESGLKTMTDALQANKQIDGVFSVDDELNVGLYQAVTEQNRKDVKVMSGGGGNQSYFKVMQSAPDGVWLASALYSPSMIVDVVKNAAKIANGEKVDSKIKVDTKIVDKTNVKDYIDASSPY